MECSRRHYPQQGSSEASGSPCAQSTAVGGRCTAAISTCTLEFKNVLAIFGLRDTRPVRCTRYKHHRSIHLRAQGRTPIQFLAITSGLIFCLTRLVTLTGDVSNCK